MFLLAFNNNNVLHTNPPCFLFICACRIPQKTNNTRQADDDNNNDDCDTENLII